MLRRNDSKEKIKKIKQSLWQPEDWLIKSGPCVLFISELLVRGIASLRSINLAAGRLHADGVSLKLQRDLLTHPVAAHLQPHICSFAVCVCVITCYFHPHHCTHTHTHSLVTCSQTPLSLWLHPLTPSHLADHTEAGQRSGSGGRERSSASTQCTHTRTHPHATISVIMIQYVFTQTNKHPVCRHLIPEAAQFCMRSSPLRSQRRRRHRRFLKRRCRSRRVSVAHVWYVNMRLGEARPSW